MTEPDTTNLQVKHKILYSSPTGSSRCVFAVVTTSARRPSRASTAVRPRAASGIGPAGSSRRTDSATPGGLPLAVMRPCNSARVATAHVFADQQLA
jgi:hypothetical protein